MGSFYQFPIVSADNYQNLCSNTTCLTYCMEQVASPCTLQDHMTHIGNGDALSAAYMGLCDQLEVDVKSTLTCGHQVSNQDALGPISTFQVSLEGYYTASSENTTVICDDWMTMKASLDTLIAAECTGTGLNYWQKFLNTVSHKCDNSLTPSWYSTYNQTANDRCSHAEGPATTTCLMLSSAVLTMTILIQIVIL